MIPVSESISVIGLALVLSFVVGKIARRIKIPQVTAYILIGVVLGPTLFNVLTKEMVDAFQFVNKIAFGLILFNIGGNFTRDLFSGIGWRTLKYSALMCGLIFVLTGALCALVAVYSDMPTPHALAFGAMLGIIAIAAAPPTTLLVIKELESEGPVTDHIMVFLALGTIVSILGAHTLTIGLRASGIWEQNNEDVAVQLLLTLWSVFGSILVGCGIGLLLSYWEQRERNESELLLAVICAVMLGQALSIYLKLEPLLLSLFMGFALSNSSHVGQALHSKVKGMGLSVYALFFVLAGAHIHLQVQLKTIGLLGLTYILARTFATVISSRISAAIVKESPLVGKTLGWSVLSHAGAALAIVGQFQHDPSQSASAVVMVIMISIFVFEIMGPIILRVSLTRADEVKIGKSLEDVAQGLRFSIRELTIHFLENLRLKIPKDHHIEDSINSLVNRKIMGLKASATLDEVQKYISEHQSIIYPVVDDRFRYRGILSLEELNNVFLDAIKKRKLEAHNLIDSTAHIFENETIEDAIHAFNDYELPALPVMEVGTGRLVGILEFRDIVLFNSK